METPSDLTWEDVEAVCKMMGIDYWLETEAFDEVCAFVGRHTEEFPSFFTSPADALEFISAEEHPLEKKYANIMRTKP